MADTKSPEERSKNMAKIRSTDTAPEVWVRKHLFSRGYRYRKNDKRIAGCPDLYLPKFHTVVFVHGCFWHRHSECRFSYMPKSNLDYWNLKFQKNIERDNAVKASLLNSGLKVLIIWECTIKKMAQSKNLETEGFNKVEDFFHSDKDYLEL